MKRTAIISLLLLLLLGTAIWWMSAHVVWLGDDIDYKYMMKGEIWQSWGKIRTIREFFLSQWIHYHFVNGRYVAHALVQLFNACLGQEAFALCNAFVYPLFALLIARAGGVRPFGNPGGILSAICLSVLCFITKMMPTCQIGYIWGMTANTAWMMGFFRCARPSWTFTALMALAAIAVGNWQESVSLGVCGGLGTWWIIQTVEALRGHGQAFDWRRSWMLLGYVVGTAANCLAPSTMGRVSDIGMPVADQLLIASYSFPAIFLLACFLIRKVIGKDTSLVAPRTRRMLSSFEGSLFIGMLSLIIFNVAIGIYSSRQLFGANLFAAILLIRILPRHRFGWILNTIGSMAVVAFWALSVQGMREVRRQYDDISALHADSPDGSVKYDRRRVTTLGFPLRAKYYEDILGLFDNDLHHSLMKDFKHEKGGYTLRLKPTVPIDGEKAERYAPGHFTVVLREPPKGADPREVIVYGHYLLPGIQAAPRRIAVEGYAHRRRTFGAAVIIPEFPFFSADSIRILPYPL